MDDAPDYQAPVVRRLPLQLGISIVIGVIVGGLIGLLQGGFTPIAITIGVVVFAVALTLITLLAPTRIEVHGAEITLVSPRSVSRYAAASVVVRATPMAGTYLFARRGNPKSHLASFHDPNRDAVVAAFSAAGVEVDPATA